MNSVVSISALANRLGVLLAVLVFPGLMGTKGVGFRLPNQDPEAIARGNAFAATADNPSAIYYNPAGITQLEGHNFRAGLYLISAGTRYESPSGTRARTDTRIQPVPQLYYVYSPEERPVAFGLGVYAPYGLSLDWGRESPFTSLAIKGKLLYATINPVVAWQIHPTVSAAMGPTINYSEATLSQGIFGFPGGEFEFDGRGVDYGFNGGVRWQPCQQWAFGVNYRSGTKVNYRGTSYTTPSPPLPAPASTDGALRFPQFVVAGVSFRPTENWNLEFNADWTDWNKVDRVLFRGTAFGDVPFTFNYRSSMMYQSGVTRKLGGGYFASAGYIFSENSSPDRNFNPLVPDADLHLGSVGFGRKGRRWDWALGYHFAYNGGREVRGSVSDVQTLETADGTYRTLNHAVNWAVTLKF